MIDDASELSRFKEAAASLGYEVQAHTSSDGQPLGVCSIELESDATETKQYLTLSVYPTGDDLDGSVFLQLFAQYPFPVTADRVLAVLSQIGHVNRTLPLGHFNLSSDEDAIQFRYVLAFPLDTDVDPAFFNDVLDMCIFAVETSSRTLMEVAARV